ncbi:hypothetical protein D3C72_784810 [compost metagenome]
MNVRIEYIYVYRTVFVPPAGGVTRKVVRPKEQDEAMNALGSMIAGETDPTRKAKLRKIEKMLSFMMSQLGNIPSRGVQERLSAMIDRVLASVQAGNLDGALETCENLMDTFKAALQAGARVNRAMGQLQALMGAVPKEAKGAIGAVIASAQQALDSCKSVDQMENIAGLMEKAVDVGNALRGMDPSSPGFAACLRELGTITSILTAKAEMAGGGDEKTDTPTMQEDGLTLSMRNAGEALKALREKNPDTIKQGKIAAMERNLEKVHDLASRMPTEGMKQLVEQVTKQVLLDTAAGKVDEALAGTQQLQGFVDQMTKLDKHLALKRGRAERLAGQLQGPAKDAMTGLLDKAATIREQAQSPDELKAIDEALVEAAQLAEKIQQAPRSPQAAQAMRRLKALEAKLGGLTEPAEPADRLMLSHQISASSPNRPKGTRPLQRPMQPGTQPIGTQPLGGPRGRPEIPPPPDPRKAANTRTDTLDVPPLSEEEFDRITGLIDQLLGKEDKAQPVRPGQDPRRVVVERAADQRAKPEPEAAKR